MSENLRPEDFINFREAFRPTVNVRPEPPIDKLVSEIVGKPIRVNNPQLIALVAKWKKLKGDSESPDNFLTDPEKIEELKKTL